MKKRRILCFFGTRPEAIKMAPVVHELRNSKGFEVIVGVSAQHRRMLDQVLKIFKIKPHFDLNLMQENQNLTDLTVRVIKRFEKPLRRYHPDLVLVHGDTTTTLGGSLAAFYQKIPVGHVEAGLRTRDPYRPFPEEINRRVTDSLATLFFAPTRDARRHLLTEGHEDKRIFVTGNTVIDALFFTRRKARKTRLSVLEGLKPADKMILITAHRRENFGVPFTRIFEAIRRLSLRFPHVRWVYPVHPNPNVLKPAGKILSSRPNIRLIKPVDYETLVSLMARATLILTDSGGIQEEAPSLGKPVLVFREVTERPEAVRAGTVTLVGSDPKRIISETTKLLTRPSDYRRMARAINPYGDGKAAIRIRKAIERYFK